MLAAGTLAHSLNRDNSTGRQTCDGVGLRSPLDPADMADNGLNALQHLVHARHKLRAGGRG